MAKITESLGPPVSFGGKMETRCTTPMLRESNVARNVAALHCPVRGRSLTVTPAFPVRLQIAAAIGIANDRSRVGYVYPLRICSILFIVSVR
jgi:hypothetical protein